MQKCVVGLLALLSPFVAVYANSDAACRDSSIAMPASTPSNQFTDVSDVAVIDKKTNLMWARCTWGYDWDAVNGTCAVGALGNGASIEWTEALQKALDTNDGTGTYLNYSDWRVPNVKELASIVERQCTGLSINNAIFPGTEASEYWTNTHVAGSVSEIRVVDFNGGVVANSVSLTSKRLLRLVRDNN